MEHTALQRHAASLQPHPGTYNGVEAVLDFGDPAAELAALRESCGVFDLPWRARVMVAGKDRVRWLHNMVTNNVRDLAPNHGCYNFVLNAQGRILGDMYIFDRGESLAFDTDRVQVETLLTSMKRFIIMDKVELSPINDIHASGICGPGAAELLTAAGLDTGGLVPLQIRGQDLAGSHITVVRGPENKPHWYEVWGPSVTLVALRDNLLSAGALPTGTQALEWWRILHGIPHYGQDIRDRDLPQETAQTQALSFNKGCYIGQEIVERIRSRGQVHRSFMGFEFTGSLAAPEKYEANGRAVAELTSVARIPLTAGEKALGLGYVREEARAAGPHIDLNGCKATITDLPFKI